MSRRSRALGLALCIAAGASGPALAGPVDWVLWTTFTPGTPGSAGGTISAPDGPITVSYAGEVLWAQVNHNTTDEDVWNPSTPYISSTVTNAPPDRDIIFTNGGYGLTNTLRFSRPVRNPVMAVWSMGRGGQPITYVFSAACSVLSYGPGTYGGPGTLTSSPTVLLGEEGYGVVMFVGDFTEISWTIPTAENYHGFTVAVPPACYANCDGSTSPPVLNVADFTCFQQKYAAGDPYANCDGSTTPPVINIADFTCFQARYANGCP